MQFPTDMEEKERPQGRPEGDGGKVACVAAVAFALAIALLVGNMALSVNRYKESNAKLETELAQLKEELAAKGGARMEDEKMGDNATDMTPGDATKEDTPEAFLKKLLTWDSYESYKAVRSWLKKDYGVHKKDPLLVSFMPNIKEEEYAGENMRFEGAEIYKLSEADGASSCFAICKVTNHVKENSGSGRIGIFYTVDKDGGISGISAYPLVK